MSFWDSITSFFGGGSGDEQVYKAQPFDQQAFLMYNISKLAPIHKKEYGRYKKLTLLKGPSTNFVNGILNADFYKKRPMLEMTQAQISELAPQVRIYKQDFSADNSFISEVEIPFPAYTEESDPLDIARVGYGIKSISLTTKGGNTYQSQTMLDCNLTLYFQSMDKLTERKDGISLLDLIVMPPDNASRPPKSISATKLSANRDETGFTVSANTFRIRLELGWSVGKLTNSSAFRDSNGKENRNLLDAIQASKMSFMLQHLSHDLTVNEDGTTTLSISYRASTDFVFRDIRAGIVLPTEERQQLDKISQKIEQLTKSAEGGGGDSEELNNYKKMQAELQTTVEKKVYSQIMGELIRPKGGGKSKVYQTAVSRKVIDAFTTSIGPGGRQGTDATTSPPDTAGPSPGADPDRVKWLLKSKSDGGVQLQYFEPILGPGDTLTFDEFVNDPIPVDSTQVEYETLEIVFLGDLLELFMTRAFEDEKSIKGGFRNFGNNFSKRVKMILTDFQYIDIKDGKPIRVNMAHIPISTKLLLEFIRQQIIIPGALNYTINDFVVELLTKLKDSIFLNKKYSFNQTFKQDVNFEMTNIVMPVGASSIDPVLSAYGSGDTARADKINPASFMSSNLIRNKNPSNYFFYMMVYTSPVDVINRQGEPDSDSKAGIPHIFVGRDRGIVKKINFVKLAKPPLMKEQRIEQEEFGFDPIFALVGRYNVELETIGNTVMPIGSTFFLWPTALGSNLGLPNHKNSLANIMGIGGYYKILTVKWTLDENGKFTTNITGNHEGTGASGDFPSNVKSLDYYLVSGANFNGITD